MIKNHFLSFVFLLSEEIPIKFPMSMFFSCLKVIVSQVSNGLTKNNQQIRWNEYICLLSPIPKGPYYSLK